LSLPPHNSNKDNLRLACQVAVVRGDLTVIKRTGFWGQKTDAIAEPSVPTNKPFFGEHLEYPLDRRAETSLDDGDGE